MAPIKNPYAKKSKAGKAAPTTSREVATQKAEKIKKSAPLVTTPRPGSWKLVESAFSFIYYREGSPSDSLEAAVVRLKGFKRYNGSIINRRYGKVVADVMYRKRPCDVKLVWAKKVHSTHGQLSFLRNRAGDYIVGIIDKRLETKKQVKYTVNLYCVSADDVVASLSEKQKKMGFGMLSNDDLEP